MATVADLIKDRTEFVKKDPSNRSIEVALASVAESGRAFLATSSVNAADVKKFLGREFELLASVRSDEAKLDSGTEGNVVPERLVVRIDAGGAEGQDGGAQVTVRGKPEAGSSSGVDTSSPIDESVFVKRHGDLLVGTGSAPGEGQVTYALALLKHFRP
jgi:hypothetical protein